MDISALQKIVKDRYFKTDSERGIYHVVINSCQPDGSGYGESHR